MLCSLGPRPSPCENKLQIGRPGNKAGRISRVMGQTVIWLARLTAIRPVLFSSQAVGVETASRDGGRPTEQADVSLSGGELCSKNYGQLIQRQEMESRK